MNLSNYIKINSEKLLVNKKRKDFILVGIVVIVEIILFILALKAEKQWKPALINFLHDNVINNPSEFWNKMLLLKENLSANMASLCNLVITFCSITTAIVVLGYTLMDNKRFGIPNRTIIQYSVGSYTILSVFMISLIKIPMLQLPLYLEQKGFLLTEIVFVLFQHIILVFFIVSSGSPSFCIYVIAQQELWVYRHLKKLPLVTQSHISASKIPHVYHAMESEELFSDKARLLEIVLRKPIEKYGKKLVKIAQRQKFGAAFWKKEFGSLYDYYYDNVLGAFRALLNKDEERHKLYDLFYGFIDSNVLLIDGKEYQELMIIVFDAILNAALVSGVKEAEEFCTYILSKIIYKNPDMFRKQRNHYFFMLELLYRIDSQKLHMNHIKKVLKVQLWEWNDADAGYYWIYWKIIAAKYTIDRNNAIMYFHQAVQTLKGEAMSSVPMLYIVQQMKELKNEH